MEVSGISHVGMIRDNNEDTIYFTEDKIGQLNNLFIVADGMGGHSSGEVASSEFVNNYCKYLVGNDIINEDLKALLSDALAFSNKNILELSIENPVYMGMGTTATVLTISNNYGFVAHVGDSRLYVLRNNELYQQTVDHTYVNELFLSGDITEEELRTHPNRNLITRAVGIGEEVKIDTFKFNIEEVSYILLCSDGLNSMLDDTKIKEIILNNIDKEVDYINNKLIESANDEGGNDNISVILIKL